jgi:hypothetical protein
MGKSIEDTVQLVISHVEGSSGNFLARLYANRDLADQTTFRVDHDTHTDVLSTGYEDNLRHKLTTQWNNHCVVVTHCDDFDLLKQFFPRANIIQIYPYTHIGNVLYNISMKKLTVTLDNEVDNHFLHIREWFNNIQARQPSRPCVDFWQLTDRVQVETLLGIELDQTQLNFFHRYWNSQLQYELSWPTAPMSIGQLIKLWGIDDFFCTWSVAWTIFVFEQINQLQEQCRTWTIDRPFCNWKDVESIESEYDLS